MNYGELRTHFTAVLNRRDLTATLRDTFLQMGIARIQRELRAPFMEKSVLVTIGSDYDGIEIPSDYIALVALTVVDQESKLQRVDLNVAELEASKGINIPRVFARQGGKWILGPIPAEDEVIRIDYYGEVGALEEDEDENTLTIIAWDLIVYAALVLAAEYFLDRRLEAFEARYQTTLATVQAQADFDEISDSVMRSCHNIQDEDV
jgi:hypothetical protein